MTRKTSPRRALTAAALASLAVLAAPAAQAQNFGSQTVGHQESYSWVSIDQRACLDRAQAALQDVADRGRLNARVQAREGWYATLEGGGLYVGVHCVADDNSSSLTSSFARRMMVQVQVAAARDLRGGEGDIRADVTDCMRTGDCLDRRSRGGGFTGQGGRGGPGGFGNQGGFGGQDGRSGPGGGQGGFQGGGDFQQGRNNGRGQGRGCNWVNAQDPSLGEDSGRGVTDPAGHRAYALQGGAQRTPGFVRTRLQDLRGCLTADAYARMYGDISTAIAAVGRPTLGWPDGADPSNPADSGRGVSNAQAHRDYSARGGAANTPDFIAARLQAIAARARPDVYAQLYAEVSVAIARTAAGS